MASARCWSCLWTMLSLLLLRYPWLTLLSVEAEQVALVEVFVEQQPGVNALLHGEVVESRKSRKSSEDREKLEGELILVSRLGEGD